MAASTLLKYAKARDDENFKARVAAAMMLKAQAEALYEKQHSDRLLTDWVLNNPMVSQERMVAFVATNAAIAEKINIGKTGDVDTDDVPDGDIIFVVGTVWDTVAQTLFPPLAELPAADAAAADPEVATVP